MELSQQDLPAPVRQFLEALETMHSGLYVACEKGGDMLGDWWMDVGHRTGAFTVRWEPKLGFGLHPAPEEAVYGEFPPERYADTAMLLRRVEQLIDDGAVGVVGLRDLREIQGLSQA